MECENCPYALVEGLYVKCEYTGECINKVKD